MSEHGLTEGASADLPGEDADAIHRTRKLTYLVTNLLVAAAVLAGALGLLGVRSGLASASAGGVELAVEYPRVIRGGLALPLRITVSDPGGFDAPVVLALHRDYVALLDEHAVNPRPSSEWTDGEWLVWEFTRPEGERFTASYDARIEPAVQWGTTGRVALRDPTTGTTAVEVSFRTVVLP